MPAQKRLVDMYPDWPNTDSATVRNEVHHRLLLLAKSVRIEAGKHGSVRYVAERSQVSHTMITRFVRGESIPESIRSWRLSHSLRRVYGRYVGPQLRPS